MAISSHFLGNEVSNVVLCGDVREVDRLISSLPLCLLHHHHTQMILSIVVPHRYCHTHRSYVCKLILHDAWIADGYQPYLTSTGSQTTRQPRSLSLTEALRCA